MEQLMIQQNLFHGRSGGTIPGFNNKRNLRINSCGRKIPVERDTLYNTIRNYENVDLDAEFGIDHHISLNVINN